MMAWARGIRRFAAAELRKKRESFPTGLGIAVCAARRTAGTALICRRKSAHQKNL